ncbi:MAG: 50S ribosomal protein L35 [Verrucomicrobia bacterium]|nr:50S ribosomal protein L35 [Verrucomicrobiota bacterium]MDE3098763.1 50S ribosomal protein L35 [Verrucomicrobiota bacterium]
MTKAREILREFFETGVRATTAAWKVLGAEALETRWGALSNEPSVSKRFKITGTGKVLFRGAGRRHLLQGKSPKRRRSLRKASVLGPTDVYRIKQNLPFSH